MVRTFIAPNKYIQGPHVLENVGEYASKLGNKVLVLISSGGKKRFGAAIEKSLEEAGLEFVVEVFNGECCRKEINRLDEEVKENNYNLVVAVGGGKVFDTAKAVAYYNDIPIIICPTIAATDAPCSALSVIYTEEGEVEEEVETESECRSGRLCNYCEVSGPFNGIRHGGCFGNIYRSKSFL